nr:unnamed protein product [Callosobruchus chinensis]
MAALCPGVQYGLSSQQNFGENKDLIFVKLTDSALRAIEEYIKNQNKFSHNPTIKFLGNENGELSFPSHLGGRDVHDNGSSTSFSFSMSSTADMEGQGGSFECIKQTGPVRGALEGLGGIPHKIRVHANDDIYEATRNRMTEAEDKYKNKCTREIKPTQTDIGRKVKLKHHQSQSQSSSQLRPSLLPVPSAAAGQGGQGAASGRPPVPPYWAAKAAANGPAPGGGAAAAVHSTSNGMGSNHVSSSRPLHHAKKPSVPDIAKRPLKERLIHLLALKPFKKIELHDRLMKEGLRERNGVTPVLKQIAHLKDNCFHLNRSLWSEVHEDWPFYSESERQILKRRKPANLTPPGGNSDGGSSSGSGQSPTSTHPGSPPPPVSTKRPPSTGAGYRDSDYPSIGLGLPFKRQRIAHDNSSRPSSAQQQQQPPISSATDHHIHHGNSHYGNSGSHYHQQQPPPSLTNRQQVEVDARRRPVTDSRDASNMNPRSRESPSRMWSSATPPPPPTTTTTSSSLTVPPITNGYHPHFAHSAPPFEGKRQISDDEDYGGGAIGRKRTCDSRDGGGGGGQQKPNPFAFGSGSLQWSGSPGSGGVHHGSAPIVPVKEEMSAGRQLKQEPHEVDVHVNGNGGVGSGEQTTQPTWYNNANGRGESREKERDRERDRNKYNKERIARVSPDSQTDGIAAQELDSGIAKVEENEFPDFKKQYVTIQDPDQRRRYKADFNADYAEYRDLHGVVEKVSKRFAQLEERLKQTEENSPKYKDIRKQIYREYTDAKKDTEQQRAKRRFQYLHEKLSHIKRLVHDYDQSIMEAGR